MPATPSSGSIPARNFPGVLGRKVAATALLAGVALALLVARAPRAEAATITVTSAGDTADSNTADGVCNDGTGACTLRAAIQTANANMGSDTIAFNIAGAGVKTITPGSALPTITESVLIDGYTQPGASANTLASGSDAVLLIELDGTSAGAGVDGLSITAGASSIKGLVINRFGGSGIDLSTGTGNVVQGNYLGTNAAGDTDLGNAASGVDVSSGSNTIGGTSPAARNVVSGNNGNGLVVTGATNVVQGNRIGTNAAGTAALPNGPDPFAQSAGVLVNGAASNTIGGTAGTTAGGPCTGACNLISGHDVAGVEIKGAGATGNKVEGNFIGPNPAGTADLTPGVSSWGVLIYNGASNNTVGGTAAGAGNVISGNNNDGVNIGVDGTGTGNALRGNLIGTNAAGTAALENGTGVEIGSSSNTVGGTTAGARNVISGNGEGLRIQAFPGPDTVTGNVVQGNYIGTNAAGTAGLGNGIGMFLLGTSDTIVGGTTAAARNVISASYGGDGTGDGIRIVGILAPTDGNQILGNYIGTDATGTVGLGNAGEGIQVQTGTHSASDNVIGGTVAGAGNIIADNEAGILLSGDTATKPTGTVIQGNSIGTDVFGNPLGNGGYGVGLSFADQTMIGGSTAAAGNTIRDNGGPGVVVQLGTENTIRHNRMSGNGRLGIDLSESGLLATGDGVTANDAGDGDGGANLRQNFPVVTWHAIPGGMSRVEGELDSTPSTTFTIDVYANAECDPQDHGEGDVFLFSRTVTTSPSGEVEFSGTVAGNPGFVTATATDPDGNTSEFSTCYPLQSRTFVVDSIGDSSDFDTVDGVCNDLDGDCSFRAAIQQSNATLGKDTIEFSIGSGSKIISPVIDLPQITNAVIIDATTQPGLPAGAHLIRLDGATSALDYGLTLTARGSTVRGLVIDGFAGAGIALREAGGNHLENNYIGTDPTGTSAAPNRRGVLIADSPDNVVGGRTPSARNVISGNITQGVRIVGPGATGNQVWGNFIGTEATGIADLGNGFQGVLITGDAAGNSVGGSAGATNTIAFNGDQGVAVASGTGNAVFQNSTFSNGILGIDLGLDGVTPNDTLDDDVGPNGLQNFPALDAAITGGGTTTVAGQVLSEADSTYQVSFFVSPSCDGSGNGEGEDYLGATAVTTDDGGFADFQVSFPLPATLGGFVTALATDADGNTSEFSVCRQVTASPALSISDVAVTEGGAGATGAAFTVSRAGSTAVESTVDFATSPGTAAAGADFTSTSGTLTIGVGEASGMVTVQVQGDTLDEADETFFVNLSNPGAATIADAQGLGTITDDDVGPSITIGDVRVKETDKGQKVKAKFAVMLSTPSDNAVTVGWDTANGTAVSPRDYTAKSDTLTFAPGVTKLTTLVTVKGDDRREKKETFFVNLSGPANATILDGQGKGIIRNDD